MTSGKASARPSISINLQTSPRATSTTPADDNTSESATDQAETDDDDDVEELDPDPQHLDVYGYSQGEHVFTSRFKPLAALIENTIPAKTETQAFPTRVEHNEHYRVIWSKLCDAAAADPTIPDSIFDPPRTYVQVRLSHWPIEGHFCCPCDLPEEELPIIEVCEALPVSASAGSSSSMTENATGAKRAILTKDLFLRKVGEAFYGENYTIGTDEDRPIIDHFNHMSSGGSLMGHIYGMVRGFKEPIWKW